MEDPSVDTSSLGRKELIAKLGGTKLHGSTAQLQVRLRKNIVKNHPIKNYLNGLDRKIVEDIYKKIASRPNIKFYERIKKFIFDQFFERCAKAPMSSLKWFMDTGNFPDVAQVGKFYELNLMFTPTGRSVDLKITGDSTKEEHATESIDLSDNEEDTAVSTNLSDNEKEEHATDLSENEEHNSEMDWMDDYMDSDKEDSVEEISSRMNQKDSEASDESLSFSGTIPSTSNNQEKIEGNQRSENTPSNHSEHQLDTFLGIKFERKFGTNSENSCYRNSVLNALLAIDAYRRKLYEDTCHCNLCQYFLYVLNNASLDHNNSQIRFWALSFNREFGSLGQKDAEEFLRILILNCANLKDLTQFCTKTTRTCSICYKQDREELEDSHIKMCNINTKTRNESINDIILETSVEKECTRCNSINAQGLKVTKYNVEENFEWSSEVVIVCTKRFASQTRKITNPIIPSPQIEIDGSNYYIKSIVKHSGSLGAGHYTAALNIDGLWILRDDAKDLENTEEILDGYLYFYEKMPLNVSGDLIDSLHLLFEEQRAESIQRNNMKKVQRKSEKIVNAKSDKGTPAKKSVIDDCSNDTQEQFQESVEVLHMKKPELINKLKLLNIDFNKSRSPSDLRKPLRKYLEKNHQIHVILKAMSLTELKNIASKILRKNYKPTTNHERFKTLIACFFFKNYPATPLSTLKKYINSTVPIEEKKIDKKDPIFQFLKNASNSEISDWTKQLGNKRMKNMENMRKWIAQFLFDFDQTTPPLETLEKFLRGELPELDANKKKEASKRKSGTDYGPAAKKANFEPKKVSENQEKLKVCRQQYLDTLAEKKNIGTFLMDNPIIEAGKKFKEIMSDWKPEDPCKVCQESWFNQENAKQGKNTGVCKRCRMDKDKEYPMFSEANEMIPGPQPDCLKDLNNIEVGAIRLVVPFVNIFKNKVGGRGYSGHSISFYQDVSTFAENLPKSLPRPIEDLQIILVRESKITGKKREFKVNGTKIRKALEWLKKNCPDYKEVAIDEETLAQYPTETGNIEIPTFIDEELSTKDQSTNLNSEEIPESVPNQEEEINEKNEKKSKKVSEKVVEDYIEEESPFDNDDEDLREAYDEFVEEQGDIPKPTHTVIEITATETIDNLVNKFIEEVQVGSEPEKVPWPETEDEPVSDFDTGYFTKAFPHLFPNGMADRSKSRPGAKPSMKQWVRHLLKVDRRFAKDHLFILVVTNIMQKTKALQLGNLYVDRCLAGQDLEAIKEKLKAGDAETLRGLSYMSSNIEGSHQMFSQKKSLATSFLRHIRITSKEMKMFNGFLTFSAADNHWDELHRLLPGHEEYVGKRLVKSLEDVEESEQDNCINETLDYILRKTAVDQNQDIVNEFFMKRMKTMWDEVLKPVLGGEYYIMRYEFQHRGCIHCHMVMSMENGPNHRDMELAKKPLPEVPKEPIWTESLDALFETTEEKEEGKKEMHERYNKEVQAYEEIVAAKEKMIEFNALAMGVFAVHPELDFENWPLPYGKNPYRPLKNVLRESFTEHEDEPESLLEFWKRLVNRVQLHRCKKGACLKESFKTVKDPKTGENVQKKIKNCRFGYPFRLNGFKMEYNEEKGMVEGYDVDIKNDGDTLGNPLRHGASYRKSKAEINEAQELFEAHGLMGKDTGKTTPEENQDQAIDDLVSNEKIANTLTGEQLNRLREEIEKEQSKFSDKFPEDKIDTMLELLRNHPVLNNHIPELLIIWGANVDQKCIRSYQHVKDYLLKYVLKPEKISEFFTRLARVIGKKVDDDAPLNKIAQKVLMSCIGQRDMTSNECFLIAHGKPYVEFSHKARTANLKGSYAAKKKVRKETDLIQDDDNWQEAYWKREELDGYNTLCTDYEKGECLVLDKHPKYLSLREFMVLFSKKWKYSPADVWPHFIPTFQFPVKKGKEIFEEYCRNLLLQDKPGCTLDNVGKIDIDGIQFDSCEDELAHFVRESPYCPDLIKEEFEDSLRPGGNEDQNPLEAGDALYIQDEDQPERAPKDDYMWLNNLGDEEDFENLTEEELQEMWQKEMDNPDPNYCERLEDRKIVYDPEEWAADRKALKLTSDDIFSADEWLKSMRKLHCNIGKMRLETDINFLEIGQLNFKQKLVYDIVQSLFNDVMEGKKTEQLFMNVSGQAGCGKSAALICLRRLFISKGMPNFMKIAAPTGTAAFLVKGITLHSLLRLPVNSSKEELKPLKDNEQLRDLQATFKDVNLLVIDEKSMIGQHMMYMIDQRLRQAKPTQAKEYCGGISVIFMGDFGQLVPVRDPALFTKHEEGSKNIRNAQITSGQHIFDSLFVKNTIIMDEVMRQGKGQEKFKECLDRLRNGDTTEEDWHYLREKCELGGPNFTSEERKEIRNSAIKVCALNRDLRKHNIQRIKALGKPIAAVKSENHGKGASSSPAKEAGNLLQDIIIAKGCRVLLSTNLWQEAGLTNGAVGEVKYIIYKEGEGPPELPALLICKFDQYIGPPYLVGEEKTVPIVPLKRQWVSKLKQDCDRTMLPIKPGYAVSIHSSQGGTLDKVIVNLGPKEFAIGLAYVACSRVRRIEDLYFDPMPNRRRFTSFKQTKTFKQRFDHDKREKIADEQFVATSLKMLERKEREKDSENINN